MQVVALPKPGVGVRLSFDRKPRLSDKEYFAFCAANPDLNVERTAEGEILIVPPAGFESSYREGEVFLELAKWAKRDGRGKAVPSSVQFILPDTSALSPDAAWVSNKALQRFSRQQKEGFLPLCPEFVVEVRSKSDRLPRAKAKMEQWIANGVRLAWLIDGNARTVHVYRKAQAPETLRGIEELRGDGPVEGFVLQLRSIWEGLR
jgi:Uma2 family endonuclease